MLWISWDFANLHRISLSVKALKWCWKHCVLTLCDITCLYVVYGLFHFQKPLFCVYSLIPHWLYSSKCFSVQKPWQQSAQVIRKFSPSWMFWGFTAFQALINALRVKNELSAVMMKIICFIWRRRCSHSCFFWQMYFKCAAHTKMKFC